MPLGVLELRPHHIGHGGAEAGAPLRTPMYAGTGVDLCYRTRIEEGHAVVGSYDLAMVWVANSASQIL
jgi:hypothetical protein